MQAEWLKQEWKGRGLLKRVQLTISGCLGPCDVPNVIAIFLEGRTVWLGKITRRDQYQCLLDWATRCKNQGRALELPKELAAHMLEDPVFNEPNSLQICGKFGIGMLKSTN